MTNKKSKQPQLSFEIQEGLEPDSTTELKVPESVPDPAPLINPYWEERNWKMDLMQIYRCRVCGTDRNDTDTIMEHILLHYPVDQQEELLTKMLAFAKKE